MVRFYLTGRWSEAQTLQTEIDRLTQMGHIQTRDWTSSQTVEETSSSLGDCAQRNIDGVVTADVIIARLDHPRYPYRGTFTELGAAMALKQLGYHIDVLIYNPHLNPADSEPVPRSYASTLCFFHHPGFYYFRTWEDLMEVMARLPKGDTMDEDALRSRTT